MMQAPPFTRRAALLAGAAAVALTAATLAHAEEMLRFGMAMPLSGGQALYGQDQVKRPSGALRRLTKRAA